MTIDLNTCYRISADLITREIEGELVLVPLVGGVGNLDSDMYSLNPTGVAVWDKLDGKKTMETVIQELSVEFNASVDDVRDDVTALLSVFLEKDLIIAV